MLKYIHLPVFLLSFALGVFAVYLTVPDKKKILVYPSPDNIQYLQYKDKAGNYFHFKEQKQECPKDPKDISKIPIQ
jgi:hypothetical protein